MPSYKRPTNAAIASYAASYREMGTSCGHHTSMTYAVMPTREDFDRAFDAVCADTSRFEFGNDPYVGTDALTADQLWNELEAQLAKFEDGDCSLGEPRAEDAGSWCSCVLGVLGFEWI